jgi:very-short-patch-repair endonuclease
LDHVTYTACLFTPSPLPPEYKSIAPALPVERNEAQAAQRATGDQHSTPPANVTVSPSIGKPHPRSEVEKALYDRICADAQLSPLFCYNIHVLTRYGSNPRVDLLCEQHKLVIEIDGDEHRGIFSWTNDRKRDVDLLLSGYRVMRFASSTLVEHTELVLSRIRDAVELFEQQVSARQESKR